MLGLTPGDAQRMRQLQLAMAPYRDGDVKGTGSLRINLSGMCLHSPLPPGEIRPDIFLQTSEDEGFFMCAKDLDMSEILAEEGKNLNELPDCLQNQAGNSHYTPGHLLPGRHAADRRETRIFNPQQAAVIHGGGA